MRRNASARILQSPILPLLTSFLYALAFPNFHCAWLAWLALVPLTAFILRNPAPRGVFAWGWASGTLAYTAILSWLFTTFQSAHQSWFLGLFCLIALSAYLGLFWGAWAWCLGRLRGSDVRVAVSGAAAWVGMEYLRTHLFSGFPWTLLGDSQYRALPLIQIASWTGVYGVSFLVVLFNISLVKGRAAVSIALSLGLAVFLYGQHRLDRLSEERSTTPVRVSLLQGNIDQYKKWDAAYVSDIEQTYSTLSAQASAERPQLIVWPETSVPGYLLQEPPLRRWLVDVVRKSTTTHVVGTPVYHGHAAYNSAFVLFPDGTLGEEYAKKHLVPFGEIVPWASVLGRFVRVLNDLGGFAAGELPAVVHAGPLRLGLNICYEAIFPDLVRRSVRGGAEILINLTNDGWYMRTSEPWQHFVPNVFRAIENDRWLLRADNTGISGIVDPVGHIVAASPIFEKAVVNGTVYPRQALTFYSRFGDVFSFLCMVIVAVSLIL